MIKTLSLLKRRPDLSREAFRAHYEEVHVPLALPLLTGLQRYVRYHVERDRYGDFGFDVLTYFGYRDKAATDAVFAAMAGKPGHAILADEQEFMDKPANRFFAVSERLLEGAAANESAAALFALVRSPESMSGFDASAKMIRDHWPKLRAACSGIGFALLRDAFPVLGGAPSRALPCDHVVQVCAESTSGAEAWAKALEAYGYAVALVETRRFETGGADLAEGSNPGAD